MFRPLQLLTVGLMTIAAASAAQANDYWNGTAQREQIHQQYLSPVEHDALHRGMNYGAAQVQPNYRQPNHNYQPRFQPQSYGSTYGNSWNGGGYVRPNTGYQSYPSMGTGCGRQRSTGYGGSGQFQHFGGYGW
jgi:hypothetical protein